MLCKDTGRKFGAEILTEVAELFQMCGGGVRLLAGDVLWSWRKVELAPPWNPPEQKRLWKAERVQLWVRVRVWKWRTHAQDTSGFPSVV